MLEIIIFVQNVLFIALPSRLAPVLKTFFLSMYPNASPFHILVVSLTVMTLDLFLALAD